MMEQASKLDQPRTKERYDFEPRTDCPVCSSGDHRTVYSSSFSEGPVAAFVRDYYKVDPHILDAAPYELQLCDGCGAVFQHYVGGLDLLSDLYTHWVDEPSDPESIPTYRSEIEAIPLSRDAHELMTVASFLGRPLEALKTLDYGMGWGLWARIAANLGCQSFGSDLSEPRMEFARRYGIETLTDVEIPQHRFDFINTEQVFEHVPQPLALANRLAGALAPGGVLKVSVPSGERVDRILQSLNDGTHDGDYANFIPVQPLEHVNCFTRASVAAMATRAGLEVVRPGPYHGYAFLRHRGTIDLRRPKKTLKELLRPIYQYRSRSNIYMWLRKGL